MTTPNRPYGRIRLYEDTSLMVRDVLLAERDLLCLARKHRAEGEKTTDYNRRIAKLDQVLDEIRRMRTEKGWYESEPTDEEGSSPPQTATG